MQARDCLGCGAPFVPHDASQHYCGLSCGNRASATIHGAYKRRQKTCEAPGCGRPFFTKRLTGRFCSVLCKTRWGRWSYPVAHPTNARVLGTTGE